jgi:hypothetical protein
MTPRPWILAMGPLLLILAAEPPATADDPAKTEKPAGSKPAPTVGQRPVVRVTISRETTRITGPLKPDGYVDYVTALDQHFKKGVTPENNAAVLFWKAMGPGPLGKQREEYCRKLGIPPLPENGHYFIPFDKYIEANRGERSYQELMKQYNETFQRPWTAKEFPLLADWLKANQEPLALVVEASRRPRRYDPLLFDKTKMVIWILLPGLQSYRSSVYVLSMRAMLRLEKGQMEEAWDDLLACHRLARLAGQGLTLIDALVGISIETIACTGDQAMVQSGRLTAKQARKMQDDLAKLAPMLRMADKIDLAERFLFLDCTQSCAQHGFSMLRTIENAVTLTEGLAMLMGLEAGRGPGVIIEKFLQEVTDWLGQVCTDWDFVLLMGNLYFDQMVEAVSLPTRDQRTVSLRMIDMACHEAKATALDPGSLQLSELLNPQKAVSKRVGKYLVGLLITSVLKVADAEDRAAMLLDLDRLAFALTVYRADHGSFPAKLADLAPRYMSRIPTDIFNNKDLHYRREGSGFLLYSVGVNGFDDGGKSRQDGTAEYDWQDDLVFRVPARTQEKKP